MKYIPFVMKMLRNTHYIFVWMILLLLTYGGNHNAVMQSIDTDKWFIGTKFYKNSLESFVKGRGMTWKTKIKIMIPVTLLMAVGFFMMFR